MKRYGIIFYTFLVFFTCLAGRQTCFSQSGSIIAEVPFSFEEHWLFIEPGDTVNGAWTHITPLQKSLFGVAVYYLEGMNKVFLCGGRDSLDNPKTACYLYDIQTNSYEIKDTLPTGRSYGKLVKVKDSLYLVGSVSNFNNPDGALYKYDPASDQWQVKSPVTAPAVHEMAACVWKDSLIITIGGSTGGFGGAINTIRVYDPAANSWRVLSGLSNLFPVNICASDAECIGNNIVIVGGFSSYPLDKVYRGYIPSSALDSIYWLETAGAAPFGTGVYRLGGGIFGNYMVFGPALSATLCINQIWGFDLFDSTWTSFLPNTIDIAARTNVAVKHTADSLHFYLFGGITRDTAGYHFINSCEKYSTGNPVIGIAGNSNTSPEKYILLQNYPNPFNPRTIISYELRVASYVSLVVFDILGKEIKVLVSENQFAGRHIVEFSGEGLASGIYFYRLEAGNFFDTKKMVLIK